MPDETELERKKREKRERIAASRKRKAQAEGTGFGVPLTPEQQERAEDIFSRPFFEATQSTTDPALLQSFLRGDFDDKRGFFERNIGAPIGSVLGGPSSALGGPGELFRGSISAALAGPISRFEIGGRPIGAARPEQIAFGEESFRQFIEDPAPLLGRLESLGRRAAEGGPGGPSTLEQIFFDPLLILGGAGTIARGGRDLVRVAPAVLRATFGTPTPAKAAGIPADVQAILNKVNPFLKAQAKVSKEAAQVVETEQARRLGQAVAIQSDVLARQFPQAVAPASSTSPVPGGGLFTRSKKFIVNLDDPKASLRSLEAGDHPGGPSAVRINVQGAEQGEGLLSITARRGAGDARPSPGEFLTDVQGMTAGGSLLKFSDPAMKNAFTRRELLEIAEAVAETLGATKLSGFRIGKGTGKVQDITLTQIRKLLGRPAPTPAVLRPGTVDDIDIDPFSSFRQGMGALKGEIVVPGTIGFRNPLTNAETFRLMEHARTFQHLPTDVWNNQRALWTIFDQNAIPQPAMISRLNTMFGEEFAGELARISRTGGLGGERVLSVINLPRALMATADLSAVARQGRVLGNSNPKEWGDAVVTSVKAFKSEDVARAVEANILRHPNYDWIQKGGIEITRRGPGAGLAAREEPFLTNLAQEIPGIGRVVRASERAHVTLLNKLRSDVALKTADDWISTGRRLDDPETLKKWQQYGTWINTATGRGPIPKSLQPFAPAMNALFFSPRFNASRIYTPMALARAAAGQDPQLVATIAKDLIAFGMTGATILGIADLAFDEVSVNWRHPNRPDFMKLKVGPTRIDFWAGFDQYAQLIGKLALGPETRAGEPLDRSIAEILGQFFEFKMTPAVGLALRLGRGEGVFGERLELGTEVGANTIPLAAQALWEAVREGMKIHQAPLHGALGLLEFFGVSVNSYTTYQDALDTASLQITGQPYDDTLVTSMANQERIKSHPLVLDWVAENERRRGNESDTPLDERVRNDWIDYANRLTEVEADFKQIIAPRGVLDAKGKDLREAISDYRNNRFQVFPNVFGNDEEREAANRSRARGPVLNRFRDEYWGAQPSVYTVPKGEPGEGSILYNFDVMEALRVAVLQEAEAAGIDPADVVKRSGDRFQDPVVRQVMLTYERDMEVVRPYFDLPKQIITDPELYRIYQTQIPEREWERELKELGKRVDAERLRMRRRSPNIDAILLKYGFVTKRVGRW